MPRLSDQFTTLEGGMNGALAPSLIADNQCAASRDVTFRDGFVATRPPWGNLLLTFSDDITEANWTGIFQGSTTYLNQFGQEGFVVSRGGRLFTITLGLSNVIREITPNTPVVTNNPATEVVTVPTSSPHVVNVPVNVEQPFSVGEQIIIDDGNYTVSGVYAGLLVLIYANDGSAGHATIPIGSAVLTSGSIPIIAYFTNPATFDFVDLFQAENYVIALAGQNAPVIYDGSTARLASPNEIPPGVFGIYVSGRIWIALNDRKSFIAGDLVGSSSGTASLQYKDAILKTTENTFLAGGGAFAIPNNSGFITGFSALETIDTSLGLGQLLVRTTNTVVSVNTPVDRTTWQNLTYPILTVSVLGYGSVSSRGAAQVNGDLWYRSIDGFRSFTAARLDFTRWNNTPQSEEVRPILNFDDISLLEYGSTMLFNNRLYNTVSPLRTPYGVVHQGLAVINFDLMSQMRQKNPPAWEGAWSGLQVFQVLKGNFNNVERAFAFALGDDDSVELWEVGIPGYYDQFIQVSGDNTNITRTAIQPFLETKSYAFGDNSLLKTLYTGEVYLDQIVDTVVLVIKYRPDQSPTWQVWDTITICANVSQCTLTQGTGTNCAFWSSGAKQYAARIMLKRPTEVLNPITSGLACNGYEFEFRIEGTGHFRLRKFKPYATVRSDKSEGGEPPSAACQTIQYCSTQWFGNFNSHGS